MGHLQPPTPIQVDNSTACGIANANIKLQRSKAIDMRFYWVRDRVDQNQFKVFWKPGKTNLADYVTKHHPASHHQIMRQHYLHQANNIDLFQQVKDSLHNLHCEGVLIPTYHRDISPAQDNPGITQAKPLAQHEPSRKPGRRTIATKWHPQQAKLINSLII